MAAIEKKVALLEQRLVLMERFVEMRFSETFRDFSIRNLYSATGGGGLSSNVAVAAVEDLENQLPADKVVTRPNTRSSNSGKRKVPSVSSKEIPTTSSASSTSQRELRIRVVRMNDDGGDQDNLEETAPQPEPPRPLKISREDEGDFEEEIGGDQENDDYFMFAGGEMDAGGDEVDDEVDDPLGAAAMDSDDQDWSEPPSPPKKKRRSRGARASTVKKPRAPRVRLPGPPLSYRLPPGGIKLVNGKSPAKLIECPVCHSHWKTEENYKKHLETCMKERTLKCKFENCGKSFFTKKAVRKHQKLHEPEKYERMCRVGGGCEVKMVDPAHLLAHERNCIRKVLGKGGTVEEAVLEDVKRRSRNFEVTLNLGGTQTSGSQVGGEGNEVGGDGGGAGGGDLKSCRYCEEKVEKKEYLKHLNKHKTWKCGICVGKGGDGEEDGELIKAFVEKKGLVRHMVQAHGFSSRKANDKAVEEGDGGEVVTVGGTEKQGEEAIGEGGGDDVA